MRLTAPACIALWNTSRGAAITCVSQPHAERMLRVAAQPGVKRRRPGFWRYDRKRLIPEQLAGCFAAAGSNPRLRR